VKNYLKRVLLPFVFAIWAAPCFSNVASGADVKPVILVKSTEVLKTDEVNLLVRIDGLDRERAKTERWQVRLIASTQYLKEDPLTMWVDANRIFGHFTLDFSKSNKRHIRIIAQIRQVFGDGEHSAVVQSPESIILKIIDPAPIIADLMKKEVKKTTEITINIPERVDDIGAIEWWAKINDDNWAQIQSLNKDDKSRLEYHFEPGFHEVKAKIFNKLSGDIFETEVVDFAVFYEPRVIISAPSYAVVGDEIKVSALSTYHGEPVLSTELRYEWSVDNGDSWEPGDSTRYISGRQATQTVVSVRVRFIDPPLEGEDKRRYAEAETSINFKVPRKVSVHLSGPYRVEEGKSYVYRAHADPPYPDMNNGVSGFFTLPNGSVIYGSETDYVPNYKDIDPETGKLKIIYTGWVNGFRERTEMTKVLEPILWQYDWPEFKLSLGKSYDYSPSIISLKASHNGDANELDNLQYEWSLPPEAKIVDESRDYMRVVQIDEPGTFTFSFTVKDSRDNSSTREAITTVKSPAELSVTPVLAFSNKRMREPLDVTIGHKLYGGHPLDQPETVVYFLNGEKVETKLKNDLPSITLPYGKHQVGIAVKSIMGYETYATQVVEVVRNRIPTCTGTMKDYLAHFVFESKCEDIDGKVVNRKWFVDGEELQKTGVVLTLSKLSYPQPPLVELIGIDDSNGESKKVRFVMGSN
jgi:hypothetical protein